LGEDFVTDQYPPHPEGQHPEGQHPEGQHPEAYGPQQPYYGVPRPPYYEPPPENHLVWAILSTVLCCLPLGIVSLVKSNQVNTLWFQGLPMEARKAAEDAKKWAMWSAISAGILVLLYIIFLVVMIIVGTSASHITP
jgi:hypothetical protein